MTQLTGLNEHTLRAWERRYGAVRPKRGDNGRRVYSRLDVERLRTISMLVERGFSIGRIAALGDRELAELLAEHLSLDQPAASIAQPPGSTTFESARIADISRSIQTALGRHDLAAIHGELQSARNLLGARSFAVDLVAPLVAHVSELSSTGHVSIGQEHGLISIIKAHLASITLSMAAPVPTDPGRVPSFVLATMEGNFQEMGIMIAGVIAATRGAMVYYLGPNIPAVALADAARAFRADQVLIGCASLPSGVLPVAEVHYLTELDERLPPHCTIWLGGTVPPKLKSVQLSRPCKFIGSLEEFDHSLAATSSR